MLNEMLLINFSVIKNDCFDKSLMSKVIKKLVVGVCCIVSLWRERNIVFRRSLLK